MRENGKSNENIGRLEWGSEAHNARERRLTKGDNEGNGKERLTAASSLPESRPSLQFQMKTQGKGEGKR